MLFKGLWNENIDGDNIINIYDNFIKYVSLYSGILIIMYIY